MQLLFIIVNVVFIYKIQLIKHDVKLNIDNFNTQSMKKPSRHGTLLLDTIRAIVVGPSCSGKTNIMYNLITHVNGLRFENIYLYTKTSGQEKYVLLKKNNRWYKRC